MQINKLLTNLLSSLNLPVADTQFLLYADKPIPSPPYIIFVINNEVTEGSDNDPQALITADVDIEFYSDERNYTLESKIADLLSKSGFDFIKSTTYITTEEYYQTVFSITIHIKEDK